MEPEEFYWARLKPGTNGAYRYGWEPVRILHGGMSVATTWATRGHRREAFEYGPRIERPPTCIDCGGLRHTHSGKRCIRCYRATCKPRP